MVKFPEATARLFKGAFVCRKCKTKMRTNVNKIIKKEVACKNCGRRSFRPVKAKKTQK
ncbi:hypothetical protein J4449_03415 [Candidatus Woesearchaeota archaeon]|nr:hypothetical protein [Candidatus Woesearchaeota archaeon]